MYVLLSVPFVWKELVSQASWVVQESGGVCETKGGERLRIEWRYTNLFILPGLKSLFLDV